MLLGSMETLAQDDAAGITLPLTPDPARCTIEPRSQADLRAIWEEVGSMSATPEVKPEEMIGTPADEATIAAVTELVVNVIACAANGNDGLRDAAYPTDAHRRENLTGMTEEDFLGYAYETPEASPLKMWLMVYAIKDIRVLPDGKITADPEIIVPGVGHFSDTLRLEWVDSRLLIDASFEGEGNLYPGAEA